MGLGITEHFSNRGAAFGDYDNDGDIDVLVLNKGDTPSLLRNDGGNKQNWIKVKLIGTKCNRSAIGARVRVVSHRGEVVNDAENRTLPPVKPNQILRIREGSGIVTPAINATA